MRIAKEPIVKTGFMCKTDFDYELGEASGGTSIYASLTDLCKRRSCVAECGIVKVEITLSEVIQKENYPWDKEVEDE